jgi:hypothetical protein
MRTGVDPLRWKGAEYGKDKKRGQMVKEVRKGEKSEMRLEEKIKNQTVWGL